MSGEKENIGLLRALGSTVALGAHGVDGGKASQDNERLALLRRR